MDVDQLKSHRKRLRVDHASTVASTNQTDSSTSAVTTSASPSTDTTLPSRPTVSRGRPRLVRSTAEVWALAVRFTCSVCGKALQNAYKLERHARTHTGDLPFPCVLCGLRFSDRHNASRHQRTCGRRKGAEQAMQTLTLSWPLWTDQPDEEPENWQQQADDVSTNGGVERSSAVQAGHVTELLRLNRWLFPNERYDAADDATT